MVGSAIVLSTILPPAVRAESSDGFVSDRAGFSARVGNLEIGAHVGATFVLPGQRLPIVVSDRSDDGHFELLASHGAVLRGRGDVWSWVAPERPGLYPLSLVDERSGETMRLNVFVMVPAEKIQRGALNGYAIGRYPGARTSHRMTGFEPFYRTPPGFVEVTPANESAELSPHFHLGQFVCKQGSRYPKYLVLRPELVTKLERLLEAVNERGIVARTLHVMSGYRTPRYNRSLGNVRESAHLFGGAADVFVDEDGDGRMDDLNGDGRVDYRDALVLSDIVERLDAEDEEGRLVGGLGHYRATRRHGPFVHVDVRGYRARWGG